MTLTPPLTVNPAAWKKSLACVKRRQVALVKWCNDDAAGNLAVRTNNTLVQTFTTDNANQLTSIQYSGLLTLAGSLSSAPTNLTVNGQIATVNSDLTYTVTNGIPLLNGVNQFTVVVNGNQPNTLTAFLPANNVLKCDANDNLVYDGMKGFGNGTFPRGAANCRGMGDYGKNVQLIPARLLGDTPARTHFCLHA